MNQNEQKLLKAAVEFAQAESARLGIKRTLKRCEFYSPGDYITSGVPRCDQYGPRDEMCAACLDRVDKKPLIADAKRKSKNAAARMVRYVGKLSAQEGASYE